MSTDTQTERVPLVDLRWQYDQIRDDVAAALSDTLERTAYVGGEAVASFERAFASYCGVTSCVGVGNGTDAIELALRAVGVGDGDRVALPTNSFVATAEAVARAGAVPVFVDCDPTHLLIDLPDLERVMRTARPKAVIPVHLYGQMAPMAEINELAVAHNALVIEDAAQSQGARRGNVGMGGWGIAAATSFYPGKNLGAFGDAGAVVTCNAEIAARVRLLANHGSSVRYVHEVVGMNSRLDTLQANVLDIKLARLDGWNSMRAEVAARYRAALGDLDTVTLPEPADGNQHVWHLYVVRVPRRDEVLAALHASGVDAAIHYPTPIHRQAAFRACASDRDLPHADAAAQSILSLPIFPGMTESQQERVIAALRRALRG